MSPHRNMPPQIQLPATTFALQFGRFDEAVRQNSGQPFTSFHSGLPAKGEDYKERVRSEARAVLQPHRWRAAADTSAGILEKLIAAIENLNQLGGIIHGSPHRAPPHHPATRCRNHLLI